MSTIQRPGWITIVKFPIVMLTLHRVLKKFRSSEKIKEGLKSICDMVFPFFHSRKALSDSWERLRLHFLKPHWPMFSWRQVCSTNPFCVVLRVQRALQYTFVMILRAKGSIFLPSKSDSWFPKELPVPCGKRKCYRNGVSTRALKFCASCGVRFSII